MLRAGSTLTSDWGAMEVKGGDLTPVADAAGAAGTIGCQFTLSGGTVELEFNYGTLKAKKDVYWVGGTFLATVDCGDDGEYDQFSIDGHLYVGGTATLQIVANNVPAGGLPANFLRDKIIYAGMGIANFVPNMAPSLTLQNPAGTTFQLASMTLVKTSRTGTSCSLVEVVGPRRESAMGRSLLPRVRLYLARGILRDRR